MSVQKRKKIRSSNCLSLSKFLRSVNVKKTYTHAYTFLILFTSVQSTCLQCDRTAQGYDKVVSEKYLWTLLFSFEP